MLHVTRRSVAVLLNGVVTALVVAPSAVLGQPASSTPPVEELRHARALSRAFQYAADTIEPSVVHITQLNRVLMRNFFDPFDRGQARIQPTGLGSGIVVRPDGYILTNYHVIANAAQLQVKLPGRDNPLAAEIVGVDQATDLAVLKVSADRLTPATFGDSDSVEVGEWVLAAGSPFGFDNSVTAGIISATGRGQGLATQTDERFDEFIQTDAAINPGNSGGPLINLEGQVIGINNQIATRTGGSVGLGFAIPSSIARPVVEALIEHGEVRRGWLGVEWTERDTANGPGPGVLVNTVIDGSPADQAGIRVGDLVTRFNGRPTPTGSRFRSSIAFTQPGAPAKVEVIRDGRPLTLTVELIDREEGEAAARALSLAAAGGKWYRDLGLGVGPLPQGAERLNLPPEASSGVTVIDLDANGPAAEAGLMQHDVLVAVNGRAVQTVEDFDRLVSDVDRGGVVRLGVVGQRQEPFRRGKSWIRGYIDVERP